MSQKTELLRYEHEALYPRMEDGEYLVSVRDNDEARLILGLELNREYTHRDVDRAMWLVGFHAEHLGCGKASSYRIMSAARRLKWFDPLVTE